jgi:hypothetical protein
MTNDRRELHALARRLAAREGYSKKTLSLKVDDGEVAHYRESKVLRRILSLVSRLEWSKLAQLARMDKVRVSTLLNRFLVHAELSLDSSPTTLESVDWVISSQPSRGESISKAISLRFEMGQGLGNQLWNYAVLRVLAKVQALPFTVTGEENFKGSSIFSADFGDLLALERDECSSSGESSWKVYREARSSEPNSGLDVSGPDSTLWDDKAGTRIEGNLQSVSYLRGHESWIRDLLRPAAGAIQLPNNLAVLHFRAGDFRGNPHFLDSDYYKTAIEACLELDADTKFLIVSDQPKVARRMLKIPERMSVQLSDLGITSSIHDRVIAPHHFGKNLATDFLLMYSARKLIIPNSSLSWWAAFLSLPQKEVVFAPEHWAGHNAIPPFWSTSDIWTEGFTYIGRGDY